MASLDLVTFEDIYTYVFQMVKGDSTDSETFNKVLTSINVYYRKVCSRKRWRFLRVTDRSFTLPGVVTTGTINLASGSRTVTGVGTSFSIINRNWWVLPGGQQTSYRVINANASNQTLLIDSPYVGQSITTGSYQLYMSEVPLWPDVDEVEQVRIDGRPWHIKPKGPAYINMMKQRFPTLSGPPRVYSLEGNGFFSGPILQNFILGYDFLGQGKVRCLSLFPHIPDIDYTVHLPYKKIITPLSDPTDEPLIPVEYRIMIAYFTLSDWYASNGEDTKASYYNKLGKEEMDNMMAKYVDTDDHMQLRPSGARRFPSEYLTHHSMTYFDTEG